MEEPVSGEAASQAVDGDVVMDDVPTEPVADTEKKEIKLDELFDDIDSDEEFPNSRPQATPSSSSGAPSPQAYDPFAWHSRDSTDEI